MNNFGSRWAALTRKVTCKLCGDEDQANKCIECDECKTAFHKECVQPLRVEWPTDEKFICDECSASCVICGGGDDDEEEEEEEEVDGDDDGDEEMNGDDEQQQNPMVVCDVCDELFHFQCLPVDARPPLEEIGDEDADWYCPECTEENESDDEWAAEHIVPDDDMTAEECFTRSQCVNCDFCAETHNAVDTWREWEPQNGLQASMKAAIDAKEGLVNTVMDNLHFKHNKPPPR